MCGSGGMADALASGASGGNPVEVQVLSAAPILNSNGKVSFVDNYEVFKKFLSDNGVHFTEDSLERGDRFFRIPQKIKGGSVVDVLVIFSERNIKVLIFGITAIKEEEKKAACYKLFNDLAAQYSFFKFYLRSNGEVNVEGDAILGVVEGEFQPKALMGFLVAGVSLVQDIYKDIMKIQWS